MTTAENSRADAPTDEQIASAWFATSDARNLRPHERAVEVVRKFLAASPVEKPAPSLIDEDAEVPPIMYNGDTKRDPALRELLARQATRHVLTNSRGDSKQPAAAPIDIGVDYLEKLRALMVRLGLATNESLEGFGAALEDNLYRTIRAVEALVDATVTPAPSPADERAAFVERVMGMFEAWPNGKPGPTDEPESHYRFGYNTALEDVLTALDVGSPTRRAASANETGAEGAAIELLRKFMEYRDSDYVPNVLFDCARTIIDNAMAAAALAEEHSTIECQAHSGPDCTECGGTGVWSGKADEREASWHCEDPVQKCRAQCDSCAKQARAATEIADERAVSFEAWCDRFPEISAVERLRDAWQEARATASPAAERVTAALQALSADVHILGDGWANDEAMIGLAKKYLRVELKPASPELSLWRDFVLLAVTDTAPQPAQADAPAEAREPIAWVTDDDRAITAAQKQRALADGGATASSVRPYSIPCYAVSAPADAGEARLTDAARDMLAERRRQVEAEGWTPEHDDQYQHGAIALAAACYAANAGGVAWADPLPSFWPWMHNWWKPTTPRRGSRWPLPRRCRRWPLPRRDLVKAGALILAELERLDRAALLNGADHDQ